MDRTDRILIGFGYVFLLTGVGSYMVTAFTGHDLVLVSFIGCMGCLFFFNWPTVRARRRQRRGEVLENQQDNPD